MERSRYAEALDRARKAAYRPGEFVGQENFMTADEILDLAGRAGLGPGWRVLDLCCGVAGPGLHAARHTGCRYVGVDQDGSALEAARARARAMGVEAEFLEASVPDLPGPGPFDAVLLFETILAFPDKDPLVEAVSRRLRPGGVFAFTLEEGAPLSPEERSAMPGGDTVWLLPLAELEAILARHGFSIRWCEDHTASHADVARRLARAFRDDGPALAEALGPQALEDLAGSHELWVDWMERGRVRKFAVVAER